jgi:ABC-type branched-subunit amino acid transport system ATPase component
VSGEVTGGLTGIFGPSGSGKTTFLNALARRLDPLRLSLSGDTQINDQPYTYNDLKSFSGYVEQVIIQLLLFSSGNRLIINTVKNT